MRTLLIPFLSLPLLMSAVSLSAESRPKPVSPTIASTAAKPVTRGAFTKDVDTSFERVDVNRDKSLSQAEIAAAEGRAQAGQQAKFTIRRKQMFDRLDTNRDGQVNFAVFATAVPAPRPPSDGKAALGQLDTDKDGRVVLGEYRAPALRRFARIDANQDGTATVEEQRVATLAR